MNHPLAPFTLGAAVLAAAASSATAATIERTEVVMAVAACQPALPAYEGAVRKRPLAVQNEGAANAFVTCGMQGIFFAERHSTYAGVLLRNDSAGTLDVTCTLVDLGDTMNNPTYLTKTVSLEPGAAGRNMTWNASENGGLNFMYPAVSCSLPTGVGIATTSRRYREDIGS